MSDKVGNVTNGLGVVENVVIAIGISTISHSVLEKHSTSGLESAILNLGGRVTSDNVGSFAVDSGVVENVVVAVGMSVISHYVPEKHSTSGLESANLKQVVG